MTVNGAFNLLASFVVSALAAHGPVGFFLSGGIGTRLGIRLGAHVDEGFLA